MLTRQKLFDTVATHLLMQGKVSESDRDEACQYHGPGNLRCAVGCLIPDTVYTRDIEGLNVAGLYRNGTKAGFTANEALNVVGAHLRSIIAERDVALLDDLQGVHDTDEVTLWSVALRELASKYDINTDAIDNFGQPKTEPAVVGPS